MKITFMFSTEDIQNILSPIPEMNALASERVCHDRTRSNRAFAHMRQNGMAQFQEMPRRLNANLGTEKMYVHGHSIY